MVERTKEAYKLWVTNKIDYARYMIITHDLAFFLGDDIELGQLIPCKDGKPLGRPPYYGCFVDNSYLNSPGLINYELCQEFQEAQSKVLFEGWEFFGISLPDCIVIRNKRKSLHFNGDGITTKSSIWLKTIEDLQKLGVYLTAEGQKRAGVEK